MKIEFTSKELEYLLYLVNMGIRDIQNSAELDKFDKEAIAWAMDFKKRIKR